MDMWPCKQAHWVWLLCNGINLKTFNGIYSNDITLLGSLYGLNNFSKKANSQMY